MTVPRRFINMVDSISAINSRCFISACADSSADGPPAWPAGGRAPRCRRCATALHSGPAGAGTLASPDHGMSSHLAALVPSIRSSIFCHDNDRYAHGHIYRQALPGTHTHMYLGLNPGAEAFGYFSRGVTNTRSSDADSPAHFRFATRAAIAAGVGAGHCCVAALRILRTNRKLHSLRGIQCP